MKKIGIFWNLSCYGGVQTCVISLIKGLNKIGIIPDLLSDDDLNNKIISEHNLELNYIRVCYSISIKTKNKLLKYTLGAIDFIYYYKTSWLKKDYDFLYIFTYNVIVDKECGYLYYLLMSPRAIGYGGNNILQKMKFIVYDYLIKYFIPVYELHGTMGNYVTISEYTAEWFYHNYNKKIKIIYPSNLIPVNNNNNNNNDNSYENKNIVFLSRLEPQKRPDIFLNICKIFPEKNFVMIGAKGTDEYMDVLNSIIVNKQLPNLRVCSGLKYCEVIDELKKAKIYVFTAKNEHFGITTVEAMMCGAIPFVHNSGGQIEIVPWDELRFNDDNYIEKFSNLMSFDQNKIDKLQKQISSHINKFSEEQYINKMLQYLKDI